MLCTIRDSNGPNHLGLCTLQNRVGSSLLAKATTARMVVDPYIPHRIMQLPAPARRSTPSSLLSSLSASPSSPVSPCLPSFPSPSLSSCSYPAYPSLPASQKNDCCLSWWSDRAALRDRQMHTRTQLSIHPLCPPACPHHGPHAPDSGPRPTALSVSGRRAADSSTRSMNVDLTPARCVLA